jgi:hypothetical protein
LLAASNQNGNGITQNNNTKREGGINMFAPGSRSGVKNERDLVSSADSGMGMSISKEMLQSANMIK